MAENDWQKVATTLRRLLAGPTEDQRKLAAHLSVPLDCATPSPVAAAVLRAFLVRPLRLRTVTTRGRNGWYTQRPDVDIAPIDHPEYDYLRKVAVEAAMSVPAFHEITSRDLLDAWLEVAWARRAVSCLESLRPQVGDIAIATTRRGADPLVGQISSISSNARLNFRGGRGRGAWVHTVQRVVRAGDSEHADLELEARKQVADADRYPGRVTTVELERLARWAVTRVPSRTDRAALREALATADAERPMQVVLERHPSLLASVVTGSHGVWVIPQAFLGTGRIPDFLIASRTSAGLRWHIVELKAPTERLTNVGNGHEVEALRRAISQIHDARDWLKENLLSARQDYPGITVDARGLILMGREDPTDSASKIRDRWSVDSRISIRTYDWLLRASEHEYSEVWGLLDEETRDLDQDNW
ncbi:Shedu anti-phage system protein SduA domain-containing protein [Streptomyces sp. YIM 98790]|uniref:Shedu anti-phage system protein SduA domain-containing protein n=1 Tax=Streptomyces sp. YIM 98790 TaxID=2689077 RepID=UPI00140AE69B|nr:Shedu anti-phage system protein SduA domain-containing protein [Streptomyces sp. YIM 98790]